MKNLILLASIALPIAIGTVPAWGQKTEGIVQFDEKRNMHRNLPPEAQEMKAMIPEWQVHKSELLFSANESLFRNVEEDEDDAPNANGVQIKMIRPEATFYRNFEKNLMVDYREFISKNYLVTDTIAQLNWKMTGETKQVLGYNCLKAMWLDTLRARMVAVWFTDEIGVPAGPVTFCNLPGMVLEVDINNGEIQYVATKINFVKVDKKVLVAPTKGEKIGDLAFQKLVAEATKKSGGPMIKINRN